MKFTYNIAVALSNGVTITSSMICCGAFLYKYRWPHLKSRPLWATAIIITITALIFGLQVNYPQVLRALRLNVDGLSAGEWWRLVTPLFVQAHGTFQFLFNMLFLITFLPMAERLYGAKVWFLYFVPGVVGQLVNSNWKPGGGGSSTAVFGIMGSILAYVLVHSKDAPTRYKVFAFLGICGAVVMCFTADGHGPSFLTGAVLAVLSCWFDPQELASNALQTTREDPFISTNRNQPGHHPADATAADRLPCGTTSSPGPPP